MNFKGTRTPNRITPCPITEAVVELRFESGMPTELIPALIYNQFRKEFPTLEKLAVMELPAAIRDQDENLRFSPHFRGKSKDFFLQIGPRAISIVCPKEYKGWTLFSKQIEHVINGLKSLNIVDMSTRIGLRYISFFENTNIFEHIKLDFSLTSSPLTNARNILRTEFELDGLLHVLQITNAALLNRKVSGSTIDIDIVAEGNNVLLKDIVGIIEKAHIAEKQLFFGILKEEYLAKFNPEY